MNTHEYNLNISRGHETEEHRLLKREVLAILRENGFAVALAESGNCDVVAIREQGMAREILALEIERNPKHAVANLHRDFQQGARRVLILSPDFQVLGQVARKLTRKLPQDLWPRVALADIQALRLLNADLFQKNAIQREGFPGESSDPKSSRGAGETKQ